MTQSTDPNTPPSTALARAPRVELVGVSSPEFQLALEPRDFEQAIRLGDMWSAIKFCNVQNTEEALARIMYGRILGMAAAQAVANVFIIDNKPGIEATTMLGLCLTHPEVVELFEPVNSSATSATWRGKRRGAAKAIEVTWTLEDAVRAKLVDRGEKSEMNNWNRYPEDMCNARAIARVARRAFADIIKGFATVEELRDYLRLKAAGVDAEHVIETTGTDATPAAVVVQHAGRDFAKEALEFRARLLAAKTPEAFGTLREELPKFEGTPIHGELKDAYSQSVKDAKAAAKAAKAPEGEGEKKGGAS